MSDQRLEGQCHAVRCGWRSFFRGCDAWLNAPRLSRGSCGWTVPPNINNIQVIQYTDASPIHLSENLTVTDARFAGQDRSNQRSRPTVILHVTDRNGKHIRMRFRLWIGQLGFGCRISLHCGSSGYTAPVRCFDMLLRRNNDLRSLFDPLARLLLL